MPGPPYSCWQYKFSRCADRAFEGAILAHSEEPSSSPQSDNPQTPLTLASFLRFPHSRRTPPEQACRMGQRPSQRRWASFAGLRAALSALALIIPGSKAQSFDRLPNAVHAALGTHGGYEVSIATRAALVSVR